MCKTTYKTLKKTGVLSHWIPRLAKNKMWTPDDELLQKSFVVNVSSPCHVPGTK